MSEELEDATPVAADAVAAVEETNGDVVEEGMSPGQELAQVKADKEQLEQQYKTLVHKLTTIRNTLGDKLKQDADELDRRAQEIEELRTANASLSYTSDTLKDELDSLNQDNAALSDELSNLRSRVSNESLETEVTLREALQDSERLRTENELLQLQVSKERLERDRAEASYHSAQQELRATSSELTRARADLKAEQASTANLSSVLEEFQASKDRELQSTLSDLRDQLHGAQQTLATYKKRAFDAETQLEASSSNSKHTATLEKDLRDKAALIGKLRHEAVLANEHLSEALRRLRNSATDTSVDRRLVTNVLLTFLTTPRADSKRFEMLKLLSTILGWSDEEREKAGLQRTASSGASSSSLSPPPTMRRGHSRQKSVAVDSADPNESFSNLWVEYLLRESNASSASSSSATSPPIASANSLPPLTLGNLPRIPSSGSSLSGAPSLYSPTRSSAPSASSTRRPSFGSTVSSTGPSSVASVIDLPDKPGS